MKTLSPLTHGHWMDGEDDLGMSTGNKYREVGFALFSNGYVNEDDVIIEGKEICRAGELETILEYAKKNQCDVEWFVVNLIEEWFVQDNIRRVITGDDEMRLYELL